MIFLHQGHSIYLTCSDFRNKSVHGFLSLPLPYALVGCIDLITKIIHVEDKMYKRPQYGLFSSTFLFKFCKVRISFLHLFALRCEEYGKSKRTRKRNKGIRIKIRNKLSLNNIPCIYNIDYIKYINPFEVLVMKTF